MSSSTLIESFEGSLPNDGEECLNIVNSTIDLDANTNEGAFTNEVTPANEVGNEENVENNDIVIQKAKRNKTSLVWEHFKEVELKNGKKKWQCLHCKRNYAIVASGSISHLKRHLNEVCHVYKKLKRILSFVHVPPPRRSVDIADAIFKCLKEWGIENKIFSVIKMMGVNMCFPLIYPRDEAKKNIEYVRNALNEMYKEYADLLNERDEEGSSRTSVDQNGLILKPKKSSGVLSQMAADVLAIPISTVASEVLHGIKKKPKVKQVPIEIELLI
ncbi:hypothetical protein P8452_10049 [Trifolium repens]|nr:hypothetical protein P8452_10049 [Trifolium repens]